VYYLPTYCQYTKLTILLPLRFYSYSPKTSKSISLTLSLSNSHTHTLQILFRIPTHPHSHTHTHTQIHTHLNNTDTYHLVERMSLCAQQLFTWLINVLLFLSHCLPANVRQKERERERERGRERERNKERAREREKKVYSHLYIVGPKLVSLCPAAIFSLKISMTDSLSLSLSLSLFRSNALFRRGWLYLCMPAGISS